AVPGQSESREICFVSDPHPGEWITRTFSPKKSLGDILDTSGRKVGEHHGIHHFTVGQRKGLRLALGRPVYVVSIDAVRNTIVVGSRQEAMSQEMMVEDLLWLCGRVPNVPTPLFTQIRYNHDPALSLLIPSEDGTALVKFDSPQFAITPGQLAVFYREEEVIGSAWIRSVVRS
ncbi:MAG: tRNA 2-thiouridine(34) synthase MnmA, partial [Kiritimatiellae bacterium]|nr:tRNA 2-thiouridine(34) synthase MnmA [Kiritimatiellia bacterium]